MLDLMFSYTIIGQLTILLSLVGAALTSMLFFKVVNTKGEFSADLAHVYLADFFKFLITLVFGVLGYLKGEGVEVTELFNIAYAFRVPVLVYLIYALWRFVSRINTFKG